MNSFVLQYRSLFFQIARFGIVGVTSAAVNFSVVILLVETQHLMPLHANVFAFLIAFQVSYWGHRYWTFAETNALHRVAFPRLLLVGGLGFIANQSLFFLFLTVGKMPYPLALLADLAILPTVTFLLNKFWVFR
jgi:putative flippase GtrA